MMKVSRRRQITLPATLCEKLAIKPGDVVEFQEDNGWVRLFFYTPKENEDDESWWLSEAWQKAHHEALEDIREGRVAGPFDNVEELAESLRKRVLG